MANPKKLSTGRLRRVLKILGVVCGVLFVLGIIAYFVVTSSGFFKSFILPRVSKAVGADVTVSAAEIHPFSHVVFRDFKVQVKGEEPILNAREIRASYSLWSIIRGNIVVNEVAVVSPVISVVTKPDGSNNLPKPPPSEPKADQEKEKKPSQPAQPSKPLQVDVKKIAITGATIRNTQQFKDGKSNLTELSGFNFSVENIKNGETAKLALRFDATVANNPPDTTQSGSAFATANGDFSFALSKDLKPDSIMGGLQFNVTKAAGALADLSLLTASLQSETTPTEIKQIALRFQRNNASLGEIHASGPFDIAKDEGRVTIVIRSLDRQALNLLGAKNGMDFGDTTINSSNQIEIANGGKLINASGRFDLGKFQVKRDGQTTPTLDLNAGYQVSADLNTQTATLGTFALDGKQNGVTFLNAVLTAPLGLAWGETAASTSDSSLTVALNDFNLGNWKAFAGDLVSEGSAHGNLKMLSQQGGKKLALDLTAGIENLAATIASNRISQAAVNFATHVDVAGLKQIQIANYQFTLTQEKRALISASGNGSCDLPTSTSELQTDVQMNLASLLAAFPQSDVSAQSGTLGLKAHVTHKQDAQTVTGDLALTGFTGKFGGNEFQDYASDVTLDIAVNKQLIQLRKVAGALRQGGNAGGTFSISGQCDSATQAGKFDIKLDGLNENAVRPFLEPMLAGKKLVSVNINGTVTAQYDPKAATSVKADAQVTRLVVNDPAAQTPASPLEAKLQVDASLQNQIAEVKHFQVTLTPTERAKNEIRFQGQVDMSSTNVIHGGLKLAADSLDLTSYYDLFAGQTNAAATKPVASTSPTPAPPSSSNPSQPETEPAAVNLPFRNFTIEAAVGKLFLHEIEITDFKTTLKLDDGRILLKPFQLSFNGCPVTANIDLNLGVPGYQYDVSFNANTVPLSPLVSTLQPGMKGKIGGTLFASAQIKGEGITGPALKKNLSGKFDIATTNMNVTVINLREGALTGWSRVFMTVLIRVINVIGVVPELASGNASTILSTLKGAVTTGSDSGLTGKLNNSTVNTIELHGTAGSEKVTLKQALVEGTLFKVEAVGTVKLQEILTNSTLEIPVIVSLDRSLATQVGLANTNTALAGNYMELPPFLTMVGTVGAPQEKIDKFALLKISVTAAASIGKNVVNVYNQLTGNTNSAANTNSLEKQLINKGLNLLEGIGRKKK